MPKWNCCSHRENEKKKKTTKWRENYGTSDKIMKLCETSTTASTLLNEKNNNWEWRTTSSESFFFPLYFFGSFVGLRWFSYDGSVSSDNDKNEFKLIEAYHVTVDLCVCCWWRRQRKVEREREKLLWLWTWRIVLYFTVAATKSKPRIHELFVSTVSPERCNRMAALVTLVHSTKNYETDIAVNNFS